MTTTVTITKAEDVPFAICYAAVDYALKNPDPSVDAYTQAIDTICKMIGCDLSDKERLRLRGRIKLVSLGRVYGITNVSLAKMLTKP